MPQPEFYIYGLKPSPDGGKNNGKKTDGEQCKRGY